MGNMHTTTTINYKDGQHEYHQNNFWWFTCCPSLSLIVLVVYMLPIFVVNCFGGVHIADFM
jgi:hypothetical protein